MVYFRNIENLQVSSQDSEKTGSTPLDEILSFKDFAENIGVSRCGILTALPFHSLVGKSASLNWWGYSHEWMQKYQIDSQKHKDEVPDICYSVGTPAFAKDIHQMTERPLVKDSACASFFDYHDNASICAPIFSPFGYKGYLSFSFHEKINSIEDRRIAAVVEKATAAHAEFVRLYHKSALPRFALSLREKAVVAEVARGKSNKELARKLDISPNSVDTYMRRVFLKLGVNSRPQAVVMALTLGLIRL